MKRNVLTTVLYGVGAALTAAAVVVQTIAMLRCFEVGTNYFLIGATLPTVAALLAILGAGLGTVGACLGGRVQPTHSPIAGKLYTALPCALLFFATALLMPFLASGTEAALGLRVPVLISCLLAGCYVLLCGLPSFRAAHPTAIALLGFSAPIACGLLNAYYYFDMSVEMNSPLKYCVQVALLFAMLYFLGEIRFHINEPKPRLFLACAFCTLAAASMCAIAFPVAFFAGRFERVDYLMGSLLMLGICVTILFRVLPYLPITPPRHTAEASNPNETVKEDDTSV